jgi:cytochrome c5
MDHDRKFFDTFMLVLGVLLAITIGLFFIANALADANVDTENRANPIAMAELEKRIAPVGAVATDAPAIAPANPAMAVAPAQIEMAPAVQVAMAPAAPAAKPAAPAAKVDGAAIYNQACVACHGAGIAGAPKFGDKAAWAPRIKQGMPTLYEHALKGFMGKGGMMPAKGGRMDFSDDQVKAGVDHMVGAAK